MAKVSLSGMTVEALMDPRKRVDQTLHQHRVTADAFRNRFGGECLTSAPGNPKPRTSATSSDAPAVTREAEEDWSKRGRR